jgi:hypothetical protein
MLSKRIGRGVVKIHYGVATKVCPDHALLRSYAIFLRLKSLYVGGCIHNYRSRYDELALKLKISPSTLRNSISFLKNKKFAISKDKHLWLISTDKVSEHFGVNKGQGYRLNADEPIEYKIQTLAIHENINKQNEAIKTRFINAELESVYGTVKNIQFRVIKRLRKHLSSLTMKEIKKRIYHQPAKFKGISAHATLSRSGIANLLGYKNKSSGSRLVKKLVGFGFLKDLKTMHSVFISKISEFAFRKLHLNGPYYWKFGKVFKAKPNSIHVKL